MTITSLKLRSCWGFAQELTEQICFPFNVIPDCKVFILSHHGPLRVSTYLITTIYIDPSLKKSARKRVHRVRWVELRARWCAESSLNIVIIAGR